MAVTKEQMQDKLAQDFEKLLLKLAKDIINKPDTKEALAVAALTSVRMQKEILDKLTIIHSEQIALSNLLEEKQEDKIIIPH